MRVCVCLLVYVCEVGYASKALEYKVNAVWWLNAAPYFPSSESAKLNVKPQVSHHRPLQASRSDVGVLYDVLQEPGY